MSYTIDENGMALTETRDGVTMPVDCSFEKVNDWIHGIDVQFEEVQALCLGMANENDRLKAALSEIKDRFSEKQSLHKDDCFAYQVASKALGKT